MSNTDATMVDGVRGAGSWSRRWRHHDRVSRWREWSGAALLATETAEPTRGRGRRSGTDGRTVRFLLATGCS